MSKQFIVISANGTPIASSADPEEALHAAKALGPTQWLAPSSVDEPEIAHNPPGMSRAHLALLKCGVPVLSRDEVERFMSKEGQKLAHATLLPIFEEATRAVKKIASRTRGKTTDDIVGLGSSLAGWTSPGSGFLSANAKLMKRDDDPNQAGVALGLNLVPEYTVGTMRSAAGVTLDGMMINKRWVSSGLTPPNIAQANAINFCTGSSAACRTSCLSNTGQNASDIRNSYTKYAKAKALLNHPAEFMAILYAAARKYGDADGAVFPKKATKFLRLNVLSDLPWELIAPWLFDEFPSMGITAYDYTKVPGRYHPNYDLTFSYSGANMRDVNAEHARGNKIAMVFLAPEYIKGQVGARVAKSMAPAQIRAMLDSVDKARKADGTYKQSKVGLAVWRAMNPLPETVNINGREVPVSDGDYTDFRPWDPISLDGTAPVVGLRWKTPRIAEPSGKRRELRLEETPKSFVVMGEVRHDKAGRPVYILPHTPNNDENSADQERAAAATLASLLPGQGQHRYDGERAKKIRRGRLPMAEELAREEWERRAP